MGDTKPVKFRDFANITKVQRNMEAICLFMAYTKASYFMSLINATAPLIDNISEVISDIKFFIVVMLIQIVAFASSFFIISQNQIDFDNLEDGDLLAYRTF